MDHAAQTPPVGATPELPRRARQPRDGELEAPHPLYCVWEITLKCDLGCKHCGSRAGPSRDDELTTEECLDVVQQMADLGLREVTLIGGEAYLREDWDVIAKAIVDQGMVCGMTTGARGLSQDRLQRAIDAGISVISVSIDGLERTHDAQRGVKGSWRSAVEAARRIGESSVRLGNNTQINRLSMPELPALASLLADMGSEAWQIQLTVPMGRGADRADLLLQPFELLDLYPLLVWVNEERLKRSGVTLFMGNNIGYFGPHEGDLRFNGHRGAHWASCPAGKWSIGLEADGKIKGCPSLPSGNYTGGMTREHRIADVVASSRPVTYVRERTVADLWGYCRSCYYAEVCKAGCTWTSQVLMGRPGNNPFCVHRAQQQQQRGIQERLVRVAEAPGLPFDQGRFSLVEEPATPRPGTVCGFTREAMADLHFSAGSIWSDADLARILTPDGRSRLPVVA